MAKLHYTSTRGWNLFVGIIALTLLQITLLISSVSLRNDDASVVLTQFNAPYPSSGRLVTASNSSSSDNVSRSRRKASRRSSMDVAFANNNTSSNTPRATPAPQSPFAYAFLVAGCNESSYKGFLWGAMVSTEIVRAHGSVADVVVMIQGNTTPLEEHDILHAMNIRTLYLPPPEGPTFYDAVLEKFRILQLTEYERVLFLDADIMPIDMSFDYMFTSPQMHPNVVRATRGEPANAGFFILAPGPGKYDRLRELIDRREIDAIQHRLYRNFDFVKGWGANIDWKGTHQQGKRWSFWFAAADQGLLYYWTKHIEGNVTLLIGDIFENWTIDPQTGQPVLERSFHAPFDKDYAGLSSQPSYKGTKCPPLHANDTIRFQGQSTAFCHEPVRSFHHFFGAQKPWKKGLPKNISTKSDAMRVFYYYLDRVNTKYHLGLDMKNWKPIESLSVGSSNDFSFWGDLGRRIELRTPYLRQRALEWNITLPPLANNITTG